LSYETGYKKTTYIYLGIQVLLCTSFVAAVDQLLPTSHQRAAVHHYFAGIKATNWSLLSSPSLHQQQGRAQQSRQIYLQTTLSTSPEAEAAAIVRAGGQIAAPEAEAGGCGE
jgi:hypothetical protein